MAAKDAPDTLEVTESFTGSVAGQDRIFRGGDLVRANDPAVKKWPHLFRAVQFLNEPRIEQATAAPAPNLPTASLGRSPAILRAVS